MLKPIGHEIWLADGQQASVAGFNYPTRMAVIRLPENRLFLWSPVAIGEELRAAVDALGEVRYLVAPNSLHHLFLEPWKSAYPEAALYAAPGLRQKRPDIHFDADLEDAPHDEWAQQLDQVQVRGNVITTEVAFFHRASGTVLFTDLLQQFEPGWFRGWRGLVARLDLMTGPQAQVPRKFRAAFADRQRARASLARIQAWPAEKVVMAHGAPILEDGAVFIRHAFRWLLR